jgi:hypothetical protein
MCRFGSLSVQAARNVAGAVAVVLDPLAEFAGVPGAVDEDLDVGALVDRVGVDLSGHGPDLATGHGQDTGTVAGRGATSGATGRGTIVAVDDYCVAAYPTAHAAGVVPDALTQGKTHAYLIGDHVTVCGFGLGEMWTFANLLFKDQPPSARCSICSQRIRDAGR